MRLQEFISPEEWQRLEKLIYASTFKAIATHQQQRATQQRIVGKPAATLKSQTAKKTKALTRKVKRIPYAAPPRPLPKPNPLPQAKAQATPAYRPIKTTNPLPPTTRVTVAKAQPRTPLPASNKPVPPSITEPNHIDQAARRILPKHKQGQNPVDLLSLDERG